LGDLRSFHWLSIAVGRARPYLQINNNGVTMIHNLRRAQAALHECNRSSRAIVRLLLFRLTRALSRRFAATGTYLVLDRSATFFTRRTATGLTHFFHPVKHDAADRKLYWLSNAPWTTKVSLQSKSYIKMRPTKINNKKGFF